MSMNRRSDPNFNRAYVRGMLRSAFVSLFWAIISERKKRFGLTLREIAKLACVNKAELSRWFKGDPNWTINTIATLAHALNVEIQIKAVDTETGEVYTPAGLVKVDDTGLAEPSVKIPWFVETQPPVPIKSVRGAGQPVTETWGSRDKLQAA